MDNFVKTGDIKKSLGLGTETKVKFFSGSQYYDHGWSDAREDLEEAINNFLKGKELVFSSTEWKSKMIYVTLYYREIKTNGKF